MTLNIISLLIKKNSIEKKKSYIHEEGAKVARSSHEEKQKETTLTEEKPVDTNGKREGWRGKRA